MKSEEYTLYGDLDGMTIKNLRELIADYPDDAYIDVGCRTEYGGFGGPSVEEEYFVIRKPEK